MKKLIRKGVFETNSSSSHSISLVTEDKQFVLDTLYPDQNGIVVNVNLGVIWLVLLIIFVQKDMLFRI